MQSKFRCAITRTPFSMTKIGGARPYAPSIDRIDCSLGYSAKNCRIVCVATNLAINRWGDGVLHTLFQNWSQQKVFDKCPKGI